MGQGPWEKYGGRADPVIAPPDPYKQAQEQRAQAGEARAQEDQQFQRKKFAVEQARADRQEQRDMAGTADEKKIATLLTRIAGGFSDIQGIAARDPSAQEPGLVESVRGDLMPGGVGGLVSRSIAGPDRRSVHDAQRDVLDALLTLGTGAAYNQEQLSGQTASYFPQYGDTQDEIKVKNQRLLRLIEAAKANAGPAWANVEPAVAPFMQSLGAAAPGGDDRPLGAIPGARVGEGNGTPPPIPGIREPTREQIYANGVQWGDQWGDMEASLATYLQRNYNVDPGEEAMVNAFWNANRGNKNMTVEGVREWYARIGLRVNDADIARAIELAQKPGVEFIGSGTEAAERDYKAQLDQVLETKGADPESVSGSIGINAADGIFPLLDEAAGVGGFIRAGVQGENPMAGYRAERDILRRERDRAEEAHPYISLGSSLSGALLTGSAGFGKTAKLASLSRRASTLGNSARAAALQRAAVGEAAKAGAKTGAFYGFSEGEGPTNSLLGAGIGAASGAALASGAQVAAPPVNNALAKVANALSIKGRSPATPDQLNVIAAGERREVPIRQPDVRPELRGERTIVRSTEKGGQMIRAAEAEDTEAMERAVARDVAGGRHSVGREGVGSTARTALERHGTKARDEARAWYQRAEAAAGGVRANPQEAIARIDGHLARLREAGENDNAQLIRYLEGQREDLSREGGLSIQAMRDRRSNLRSNIRSAGLDLNRTEAIMLDVLDGGSRDIERTLAGNPKALNAYRRGDRIWAERADFRRQVTQKLLGRDGAASDEAVAARITTMARDNFRDFNRMWEALEPEEQADIAATFALSQGRGSDGAWSPARFISDLTGDDLGNKARIAPNVQRLIFGRDGMAAIEDLRAIAAAKNAAASEMNVSRTGNVVQSVGRGLRALMLTVFGFATGGAVGAVAAPAANHVLQGLGEKRAARLLLNPDFTKWLRSLPEANSPQAIDRQFARLEAIAAKSPAIAGDINALQQALAEAFTQSPGRLAAQDQENN